jgi:hypothetical protein
MGDMEAVEGLRQPPTLPTLISQLQDTIDRSIRRRDMWISSPAPASSGHGSSQCLKVIA